METIEFVIVWPTNEQHTTCWTTNTLQGRMFSRQKRDNSCPIEIITHPHHTMDRSSPHCITSNASMVFHTYNTFANLPRQDALKSGAHLEISQPNPNVLIQVLFTTCSDHHIVYIIMQQKYKMSILFQKRSLCFRHLLHLLYMIFVSRTQFTCFGLVLIIFNKNVTGKKA